MIHSRTLVYQAASLGCLVLSGFTVWSLLFGETFAAGVAWFLAVACWLSAEGNSK